MLEDLNLISEIKRGNQSALNILFEKYYLPLCSVVNSIINHSMESEEIVADVFSTIWNKRKTIDIKTNVKGYLVKSAKNQALMALRRRKEYVLNFDSLPEMESSESADSLVKNEESKKELSDLIKTLPRKTKTIFLLSRKLKFTYKEIATSLEVSEKTVEKHMSEALRILRKNIN